MNAQRGYPMADSEQTVISIRRTISTKSYESVTVEISETYPKLSDSEKRSLYKKQSEMVEKCINHEKHKYGEKK